MSYGSMSTGLGTPVGGDMSIYGSTSGDPYSSLGSEASSYGSWDFGSTVDANLWATGMSHIGTGIGELYQSGLLGTGVSSFTDSTAGSPYSYTPLSSPVTQPDSGYEGLSANPWAYDTGTTSAWPDSGLTGQDATFDSLYKYEPIHVEPVTLESLYPGTAGGDGLDTAMAQLNEMLAGYRTVAPQNDVANLVNRATQDPRLTGPVTQIANDAQGNTLLTGALDAGLRGIEVAEMPAGYHGQYLPDLRTIQIAPATLPGNDLIRTLVHELVHAATPGNASSLNEENLADRIGTEIQQRLTGLGPGYILGGNAYNTLPQDNGIASALRLLGVNV